MKKGDYVYTPRFCNVTIEEVYASEAEANAAGYKEPTHYKDPYYTILGKSLDMYHMQFAAACKRTEEEMNQELYTVYCDLYEDNLEAAVEEYAECFMEEFAPPASPWSDRDSAASAMKNLLGEIREGCDDFEDVLEQFGMSQDLADYFGIQL